MPVIEAFANDLMFGVRMLCKNPAFALAAVGVRVALGRSFLPEEDRPGHNHVAILSHRAWQERFGASRDIAGSRVTLNDVGYTVVGVLPAESVLPPAPRVSRNRTSSIYGCRSRSIRSDCRETLAPCVSS